MSQKEESQEKGFKIDYDPTPLSPKQQKAVLMLVEGHTKVEVAKELKVTKQTITAWFKQHRFIAEYNQLRADIVDAVRENLRNAIKQASETLLELMDDNDPKIRLASAKMVIDKVDCSSLTNLSVGPTSVQGIIESEYTAYRRKHLYGGNSILSSEVDDDVKDVIANIIKMRDQAYGQENDASD